MAAFTGWNSSSKCVSVGPEGGRRWRKLITMADDGEAVQMNKQGEEELLNLHADACTAFSGDPQPDQMVSSATRVCLQRYGFRLWSDGGKLPRPRTNVTLFCFIESQAD